MVDFTTTKGEVLTGNLVREYQAFEGGIRYIIRTSQGEYRCVKDATGKLIEYVA